MQSQEKKLNHMHIHIWTDNPKLISVKETHMSVISFKIGTCVFIIILILVFLRFSTAFELTKFNTCTFQSIYIAKKCSD